MSGRGLRWAVAAAVLLRAVMAAGQAAPAHAVHRTYVGQNLLVPEGEQIADATCVFCSVEVEGEVSGRVLVLFGNVSVTGRVGGDVAVLDGNAVLDEQARVGGDIWVVLGNAVDETENVLAGSTYVLGGRSSGLDARGHRRLLLSPQTVTLLAVVCLGAGGMLLMAGRRQRRG